MKVQQNIRLPEDLRLAAKKKSRQTGVPVSKVIRVGIREVLDSGDYPALDDDRCNDQLMFSIPADLYREIMERRQIVGRRMSIALITRATLRQWVGDELEVSP